MKHINLVLVFVGLLALPTTALTESKAKGQLAKVSHKQVATKPPVNEPREIVIESVLASIDGVPITLREFSDKLVPKRKVSVQDFANDPELGKQLDSMIMERLIEAEATNRKIKANPDDIQRYMDQVASQNNLTPEQFELALIGQGKTIEEFRRQAKLEILRSRLMGQIAQSAPAVTDEELGESDKDKEEADGSEENQKVRFKIREIVLLNSDAQATEQRTNEILEKLSAGQEFASVAKQFSQGPTAQNGGDLGELAEEDLSDSIKDAVANLSPGEYSKAVEMADSIRIFQLERKYEEGEASNAASLQKEQLRKQLESRKLESKFQEFFSVDLPKLHKVERKV